MTWFKVDDTFNQHSRVAALESGRHFAEAIALWTLAGSWSAQQLTEGFIPTQQLRRLVPFKAAPAASELVRVGLWDEVDGGYQFHDWLDYQPTKDEVETKRKKSKCRSRKYRERKKIKQLDASVTRDFDVTQRVASRPRHAPPSRPVPSQLQPTSLTCVADARAPELGTVSAETARAEYLARWSKVSKTQPPLVARGPGASVWLDLAREVTDPAGLTKLLDAAFVDDFVSSTGWTPNAIRGAAQRLLTQGPKAKHSGPARPRAACLGARVLAGPVRHDRRGQPEERLQVHRPDRATHATKALHLLVGEPVPTLDEHQVRLLVGRQRIVLGRVDG